MYHTVNRNKALLNNYTSSDVVLVLFTWRNIYNQPIRISIAVTLLPFSLSCPPSLNLERGYENRFSRQTEVAKPQASVNLWKPASVFAVVGTNHSQRNLKPITFAALLANFTSGEKKLSINGKITKFIIWNSLIYNGNSTEWSAIWSEIIHVISKSNERAARVRFEITSMISDQNSTTRSSITTLLDPFWNRTI